MKPILKILAVSTLAMAAFGADNKLNFNVEFPFQIGKLTMPAGEYSIMETGVSRPHFWIMNVAARTNVLVWLPIPSMLKATDEKPSLLFRCGASGCEIANVKNLRSGYVFQAWSAKQPILRTVAVALRSADNKAD